MNIPDYITHKKNLIRMVVFTAIFALVFINIYKPFSSNNWYNVSEFKFFVYSSLIILTGLLVVIISRIIMYFYSRKSEISYWKYGIWVFFEILLMSLFYTIYTISVNRDRDIMDVFKSSFINTTLVLLLPYAVHWMFLGWKESSHNLEQIKMDSAKSFVKETAKIPFTDEKGILRLSLMQNDLLYIESCDNYVTINYTIKGIKKRYLLRNRLKNIQEQLIDSNITRCHRTCMVNLERAKLLRRDGQNLIILLESPDSEEIYVSKSYQKAIIDKFTSRS